jgi:hypothetical protein
MYGPFTASTPSDYLEYGAAIADNLAWQMTTGFNILHCNPFCETTDRMEFRHTIQPGRFTVQIETFVNYFPDSGHFGVPGIEGKLYAPSAPAIGNGITYPATSRTWYIGGFDTLWKDNLRIIIGLEERIDATAGPSEQVGLYRTLTATCSSYPLYRCEWWV